MRWDDDTIWDFATQFVPDEVFGRDTGQCAELIKLNLVIEGGGTIWLSDIELLRTPLRA
jgi:hypothetical protein